MKNHQHFLIALGGNLPSSAGTPDQTLRAALQQLERRGVEINSISRFYETPCFPSGAGPDYVNAAALVAYAGEVGALLEILHEIEKMYGRVRDFRWGRRSLDLDLIAAGDTVLPDLKTHAEWRALPLDQQVAHTPDELILPHPRLQDRAFVLMPLADVAPDWVHPVLRQTVEQMLEALPDKDKTEVRPL